MTWHVLITRKIPDAGIDLLRENGLHIEIADTGKPALSGRIVNADALLCLLTDTIDRELIERSRRLKIVANYAVGYNNIDVAACSEKGIAVTNTPGVLTETTADMAMTLMLTIAKRVVEADAFVRDGKFKGWEPMLLLGADITGKTIGIIGAGRIGQAVARRAAGFDMRILYTDPNRIERIETKYHAKKVTLEHLLEQADYVSLHVPLDASTHHLINADRLTLMKKGAFLINTSRGPVVDEKALTEVLKTRRIGGAALDVFENEPEITPGLTELPNVVLLPHLASATVETRDKMARMAAENIVAMAREKRPPNLVNPEIFEKGR
jgi:glyoxylate reductase